MTEGFDTEIFYVSSHGVAGDHWFEWFARSLNAHPDLMIYMGESVRSKYLKERSRKDRPDLMDFTRFLIDLGASYEAIGECFAYRAYQLEQLKPVYGDRIRFINVMRHPYCWLGYYVDWRCSNMNMPAENTEGVDHEWRVTCHDEIRGYGLRPYQRKDVEIWAFYQGILILNRMVSDKREAGPNLSLETIVADPDAFQQAVSFLTHDRIFYDRALLDTIYSWVDKPFRANRTIRPDPQSEYHGWPEWKKEAFKKIVRQETVEMFRGYGYVIQ
ncbi:MAG: hypothetical protein ACD_75C00595G0004 [uncultured bacterium]|nr:MAG: hypothetical protein ACD_75C00595G0004 [uncultured bacterium]